MKSTTASLMFLAGHVGLCSSQAILAFPRIIVIPWVLKMNHGMKVTTSSHSLDSRKLTMFTNIRLTGGTSLGEPHGLIPPFW